MNLQPHQRTLKNYLGIENDELLLERKFIEDQTTNLYRLNKEYLLKLDSMIDFKVHNARKTNPLGVAFRHYYNIGLWTAVEISSDQCIGFISANQPFSCRHGIGVGSHLAAYYVDPYLKYNRQYSKSGFMNRISAHALLVTWALLDGKSIPPEVLEDYCCINGRLESREKFHQLGRSLKGSTPPENVIYSYTE